MLVPRALNVTKNPVNFCSSYLFPVPNPYETRLYDFISLEGVQENRAIKKGFLFRAENFFKDAIKDSQERKGTIYYFDSFSYLS
ncbi:MAG: hypothetical protein B1H11_10080 [Desulfobacteraceae bacterium 4484_190.1]|nr:MAG: hypothetical protein B1H11_10080 [Desulfobacteraceae bacterium 4484_190.1]